MTEPTQAQIEALRRIANCGQSIEPDHWKFRCMAREVAQSALNITAAAQVGEQARKQFNEALELALVLQTKRDTIERCAQVADAYTKGGEELGTSGIHTKIAAAIRKLKDET